MIRASTNEIIIVAQRSCGICAEIYAVGDGAGDEHFGVDHTLSDYEVCSVVMINISSSSTVSLIATVTVDVYFTGNDRGIGEVVTNDGGADPIVIPNYGGVALVASTLHRRWLCHRLNVIGLASSPVL